MKTYICDVCGAEFMRKGKGRQLRCSDECSRTAKKARDASPEYKAKQAARFASSKYKAWMKSYEARPERKALHLVQSRTPERRAKQAAARALLKLEAMKAYGGLRCSRIGCTDPEPGINKLTLAHTRNDGAEHRRSIRDGSLYLWLKRNNYPQDLGLAVECFNCNCGDRHLT